MLMNNSIFFNENILDLISSIIVWFIKTTQNTTFKYKCRNNLLVLYHIHIPSIHIITSPVVVTLYPCRKTIVLYRDYSHVVTKTRPIIIYGLRTTGKPGDVGEQIHNVESQFILCVFYSILL